MSLNNIKLSEFIVERYYFLLGDDLYFGGLLGWILCLSCGAIKNNIKISPHEPLRNLILAVWPTTATHKLHSLMFNYSYFLSVTFSSQSFIPKLPWQFSSWALPGNFKKRKIWWQFSFNGRIFLLPSSQLLSLSRHFFPEVSLTKVLIKMCLISCSKCSLFITWSRVKGQEEVQNECVGVTENPAFQCQEVPQGKRSFGSGSNSLGGKNIPRPRKGSAVSC
jgi:hypothetical protein